MLALRIALSLPRSRAARLLLLALLGLGCRRNEPRAERFALAVEVADDAKAPLSGANVLRDGKSLATTGTSGQARLELEGAEGDRVFLEVRCPENYVSPTTPLEVSLRHLQDPSRLPVYRAVCSPAMRTVVVAVRATGGPNLPVLYLGREVARTDASGAAHVELRLRAGERFELSLSTREKAAERLLPQNPSAVFVVKSQDEMLFFDQRFEVPVSKARPEQRPKAF